MFLARDKCLFLQRYDYFFIYPTKKLVFFLLVLKIHFLHAIGDACQYFIGDGVERIGQDGHGQMFTEYFYAVPFLAVNVGHVNHRHIHTDIAHIGSLLSVHKTIAGSASEVAVEPVGIADRDGGDAAVTGQDALAAVAHSLLFGYGAQLEDGGLESAHGMEDMVVAAVDAIKSQSQSAHVELATREVFDTCAVADMTEDVMVEGCLQCLAGLMKERELVVGKPVEIVAVTSYEMGEYRTGNDGVLMLQPVDKFFHLGLGIEA